jgi:hypothetical protein
MIQVFWGILARPYLKSNQHKRAGVVAQAVKYLLNKCEALSSVPSTEKKKKMFAIKLFRIQQTNKDFFPHISQYVIFIFHIIRQDLLLL